MHGLEGLNWIRVKRPIVIYPHSKGLHAMRPFDIDYCRDMANEADKTWGAEFLKAFDKAAEFLGYKYDFRCVCDCFRDYTCHLPQCGLVKKEEAGNRVCEDDLLPVGDFWYADGSDPNSLNPQRYFHANSFAEICEAIQNPFGVHVNTELVDFLGDSEDFQIPRDFPLTDPDCGVDYMQND